MRRYIGEEKSGMGGGGVAAFLVLIAATSGAFFATDAGAFKNAPTARIAVLSLQDDVAPGGRCAVGRTILHILDRQHVKGSRTSLQPGRLQAGLSQLPKLGLHVPAV